MEQTIYLIVRNIIQASFHDFLVPKPKIYLCQLSDLASMNMVLARERLICFSTAKIYPGKKSNFRYFMERFSHKAMVTLDKIVGKLNGS